MTALVLLSPTGAQALTFTVNVNGQNYSITTTATPTTYNLSSALLQSQPWWNNLTLADDIANAVQAQLGTPNLGPTGLPLGPLFAATTSLPSINALAYDPQFASVVLADLPVDQPSVFAIQAVPGPLPLFGAAAAFGMSRRLRRRIRRAS